MERPRRATLLNKALAIGLATAAAGLLLCDAAFFIVHSVHTWRQWDFMHERALQDWARMCEDALADGRADALRSQASLILVGPLAIDYAYVADSKGRLLVHSDPKLDGRELETWKRSLPDRSSLEVRKAIPLPDGSLAWAALGYPRASEETVGRIVRRQRGEMVPPVLMANAAFLLFVALISIVVARTLIRPVHELAAAARRVAGGDLSARVPVSGSDELSGLQEDFNAMTRRLGELDELKAQFLAKISHDLRTPISGIKGHAELLAMELKGPLADAQKSSVGSISRSADFLAGLVNNILDMTAIEAGRMAYDKTKTDVAELVSSVATLMRGQAEQYGVALVDRIEPGLPSLDADPQALRRVVTNLLSNALKFTPKGGTVTVEASRAEAGVRLRFTDTGIGIPADKLPSLFSKFTPIHRANELPRSAVGTGLGLAICKEIVEAHAGRIEVRSEPGRGTVFEFTLPA